MRNEQSKSLFTQYIKKPQSKYFTKLEHEKQVGRQKLLHIPVYANLYIKKCKCRKVALKRKTYINISKYQQLKGRHSGAVSRGEISC